MSLEEWLVWADRTYFGAATIAAVATAVTVVAGVAQNRLSSRIADARDRAFADFRLVSQERARELEKQTAEVQKANTELQIRLEEERTNRLRLQNALSARHISPESAVRIAKAIRGKVSRVSITTTTDAECVAFAQDVMNAIERAGVAIGERRVGMMSPPPSGLVMFLPPEASVLAASFADEGFAVDRRTAPVGSTPTIVVGQKPPPS